MFTLQSEFLFGARSRFDKCVRLVRLLKMMLRTNNMSAHVYGDIYSPQPRNWYQLPGGNVYEKIITRNRDAYLEYVKNSSQLLDNLRSVPCEQPASPTEPFWNNRFISPFDAVTLYGIVARKNPAVYLEVGSGNSTKFVRRAVSDHRLRTRIVSIDPCPRAEIDTLCDETLRTPAENVPVERFASLNSGDVLFIDNSHRSFQNSDVTFFFTEILPSLKPGVIYGIHDIFLPGDYPPTWAMRFYSEQYLLMAYLLGGAGGDEILFPVAYASYDEEIKKTLLEGFSPRAPWGDKPLFGCAFWMVKSGATSSPA